MTINSSPTANEATPPSAALKFVQKSKTKPTTRTDAVQRHQSSPETTTRTPRRQVAKQVEKPTYQPFSTRLRSDLKRRLKRLSYEREEQDAEVKSVQQFVEEAILKWLDSQDDVSARN